MWSDRCTPERLEALVAGLREVLPEPPETVAPVMLPMDDTADPVCVAAALNGQPGFLWMDGQDSHKIFTEPVLRITVRDGEASLVGLSSEIALTASGFEILEAALQAWGPLQGAMLCGYLGYELGAEIENLAMASRRAEDAPDLVLALYDHWFVHDYTGWLMAGTDAWRDVRELDVLRRAPVDIAPGCSTSVTSVPDQDGFQSAVARLVTRVYAGEVFQVNLCRRLEAPLAAEDVWGFYLRLREISPAAHGAFLRVDDSCAVLSVSPELFLRVEDGEVRSYPIKGTRPRGATPGEDTAMVAELLASEKDRAELAMIVDVTRNDLGRVCRPGTVRVGVQAELMTLPTVHHTVSKVIGQLREDATAADVLRACFPPASISGAPKIRAVELAAEEEGFRRGPCMGSLGWISLDGRMEMSVGIRTAVASHGRTWYLAGCGITAESDPKAEFAESEAKAAAFLRALSAAATPSEPTTQS